MAEAVKVKGQIFHMDKQSEAVGSQSRAMIRTGPAVRTGRDQLDPIGMSINGNG